MPELPYRPDPDQLRRQARELLRAATDGEPSALARLHAVSERVTLSSAQLAVAREYGFPSWPQLQAQAQHRRLVAESAPDPSSEDDAAPRFHHEAARRSFGGAAAVETLAGVLSIDALVIGRGHAVAEASLLPSPQTQRLLADRGGVVRFDDVPVTDNRGASYTLQLSSMSVQREQTGQVRGPIRLQLGLDPVPQHCEWLELRSHVGSATRLVPSARPTVRMSPLRQIAGSPAERELARLAQSLIELWLADRDQGPDEDRAFLQRHCSAALARAAELTQSGQLLAASGLPDQLALLCAALTSDGSAQHLPADRPAEHLPTGWAGVVNAAQRKDGQQLHLDIATELPPIDGVLVQFDSLSSDASSWRAYLRAKPSWWEYGEDSKRAPLSVQAEDDRGGIYVSRFGGSEHNGEYEELTLQFRPRLDPRAQAVTLTFAGATERVAVEVQLTPVALGPSVSLA